MAAAGGGSGAGRTGGIDLGLPARGRLPAAVAVWIAAATLQREQGPDAVFSNRQIIARVREIGLCPEVSRNALAAAVSVHGVANAPASPGMHRYLYRTGRAQYRLYRTGDPFNPTRKDGTPTPASYILPASYKNLLPWYVNEYCAQAAAAAASSSPSDDNDGGVDAGTDDSG